MDKARRMMRDRLDRDGIDLDEDEFDLTMASAGVGIGACLSALVTNTKRCLVHDETYTNVCRGCRSDEIAAEESA
jgi:hypothetical protein